MLPFESTNSVYGLVNSMFELKTIIYWKSFENQPQIHILSEYLDSNVRNTVQYKTTEGSLYDNRWDTNFREFNAHSSSENTFYNQEMMYSVEKDDPNIRSLLLDFFNSTDGPNWHDSSNWDDYNASYCSFFGITCDSSQQGIRRISLNSNNLIGTLPSTFLMNATSLTNIDISFNIL